MGVNDTLRMYKSDEAVSEREKLMEKRARGWFRARYLESLATIGNDSMIPDRENRRKTSDQSYDAFCVALVEGRKSLAAKTRKDYLSIIENRIRQRFEKVATDELSVEVLQEWIDGYDSLIDKMFVVLRMTLTKLFKLEITVQNLYERLEKPEYAGKHTRHKEALTRTEKEQFLAYFKGHRVEHAVQLMFATGMRVGECLALRWKDIQFVDEFVAWVCISASMGWTDVGGGRKAPKTKSRYRTIPVRNRYLVTLLVQAKKRSRSQWVVESRSGRGPIENTNFSKRYFKEVGEKLGIRKRITSHVARHTFIFLAIEKGLPITQIMKFMGHASTEMITRVYAYPVGDESEDISYMELLNA